MKLVFPYSTLSVTTFLYLGLAVGDNCGNNLLYKFYFFLKKLLRNSSKCAIYILFSSNIARTCNLLINDDVFENTLKYLTNLHNFQSSDFFHRHQSLIIMILTL